jgi:hypothetical protein
MAPELGRDAILEAGFRREDQKKIIQDHSELILETNKIISSLERGERALKGEAQHEREQIHHYHQSLFKKNSSGDISKILDSYNGQNRDEVIANMLAIGRKQSYHNDTKILEKSDKAISNTQVEVAEANKTLNDLFQNKVSNSFSSDIDAMGKMFQNDFKLDLAGMGLSDMLNADPSRRPGLKDVISKLDEVLVVKYNKNHMLL